MKKLVVLLLVSLVATSAMAQIDPDPNSIGIYFDTQAGDNCLTTPAFVPFQVYLCVTNTTVGQIGFYEFSYNFVGTGGPFTFVMQLDRFANDLPVGETFNIGAGDAYSGDYIVAMADGMPGLPVTIIHSWQYIMYELQSFDMFIFESTKTSVPGTQPVILDISVDPAEFSQCAQSTGGFDIPVAQINPTGDCVVALEAASFGSVKSLFR